MTTGIGCGTARRLLWPDHGPRRATEEVDRAQAHLTACAECREFVRDMRTLAAQVHDLAPRSEAPAEVRDRLFAAVARARTAGTPGAPPRRQRWWPLAGAVAVAAALSLAGAWWLRPGTPDGAMAGFAEEHVRATRGEGIATSDSLTAARWLAARLPMAIEVPLFPAATLEGARLGLVAGRPGAVLTYALGGRALSYYIVPGAGPGGGGAGEPRLRYGATAGYGIVAWQHEGLTHALVADLPQRRLTELARYCIHQMMASLGGSPARAG